MEIGAVLLAGLGLEDGTQHVLDRTRNERRAEYEHVRRVLPAQRGPKVLCESQHGRLVLASVRRRRCAHADERDLAALQGVALVARHSDPAARDGGGHELDHALLDDRCLAGRDQVELGLVDVHADDAMPIAREASQRDGADVAETEDTDVHSLSLP